MKPGRKASGEPSGCGPEEASSILARPSSVVMSFGERLGRLWFYRGKGMLYVEAVRQWILPLMGATAATKYLGWQLRYAIPAWIVFALVAETTAVVIGWLERRSGATAANYDLAKTTDPFKVESLRLAAETAKETRQTRIALVALYQLLVKRPPPAP